MNLSFVEPRRELRPYIKSFWVFESSTGMPTTHMSFLAPNGYPKMVIPYENSLEATVDGRFQLCREQGLYFVGNRISSAVLSSNPRPIGFIAIEFSPHGAFPLFEIPMQETVDGHFDAEVVFGTWGRKVKEKLGNLENVGQKVHLIQDQLVRLLNENQRDNRLVDFCVRTLAHSHGRIPIKELERTTGFTRRYLAQLFRQQVGLSPKALAGIFRFQKFYQQLVRGLPYDALKGELHDYYYDQAHFTKEFKRMTGYSPLKFSREVPNEFGRRLS
jgi:AraC-like DNA-binding protein